MTIVAPHMVAPGCMLVSMILQVKEELVIGGIIAFVDAPTN